MSAEKDDEVKNLREQVEKLKEQLNELSKQLDAQKEEEPKKEQPSQPNVSGAGFDELGNRIGEYVGGIIEGVMNNVMSDLDRSLGFRSHKLIIEKPAERETVKANPKIVADLMSALGHENRIAILAELVSGGRYSSELQEKLPDIGASTLSSHLDVLEKAGLIVQEKARGRYLITMPGRLAYQMANEIAKHVEENSL
jgi:DNA-binding transcriptional ArsR family regulator